MTNLTILRPPPPPEAPAPLGPYALRGLIALIGVNADALAEVLAEVEAIRFDKAMPADLRARLGVQARLGRDTVGAVRAWVNTGLGR